jgi:hypothetical protein
MHTCIELIYRFAFGHYSIYSKVAELKRRSVSTNSHRGEGEEVVEERKEMGGRKGLSPLEDLRALLLVVEDRVASALWRLLTWLSE